MTQYQPEQAQLPEEYMSSPIPSIVSISDGGEDMALGGGKLGSSSKLEYGAATPGTMATTASLSPGYTASTTTGMVSPLGMFATFALSSSRALFADTSKSSNNDAAPAATATTSSSSDQDTTLGAAERMNSNRTKHDDDGDDDDDRSLRTTASQRLGISAPAYSSDDDSVVTAGSNRIGIERTDYEIPQGDIPLSPLEPFFQRKKQNVTKNNEDDDNDDHLWQLKLQQQANAMHHDSIPEEHDDDDGPKDSIERLLHKPTADGHYLVNSRPLDAPMHGLKYCLTEGKSAMSPMHRRASDSQLTRPKTRPNVLLRNPSSNVITSTPPKDDLAAAASFKIFVLLVAPRNKIFEIIQVFYAPLLTTVQQLVDCIPQNATEPALATQSYTGMCRLNGQSLDLTMMASASAPGSSSPSSSGMGGRKNSFVECAKVIRGEILVAIPKGYTSAFCSQIAKPILANPKVTKLLKRSDPLAPSKRKKKHNSSRQKYKSIQVKTEDSAHQKDEHNALATMPYYHPPQGGGGSPLGGKEQRLLQQALLRASAEAESTNAEILRDENSLFTSMEPHESSLSAHHPHLAMDLWQTQMSFRSDSSSASSVDSFHNFASPTRSGTNHRPTFGSSSSKRTKESPASVPESPFESPTLGLDVTVTEGIVPNTPSTGISSATTLSSSDALAALHATLQSKDVNGAIEAFGKILSGMGSSVENEIIMAQLIQAVQQKQMER